MPRSGPRKIQRYSAEFKVTAVRLSQQPGLQVQAVARALAQRDPNFECGTRVWSTMTYVRAAKTAFVNCGYKKARTHAVPFWAKSQDSFPTPTTETAWNGLRFGSRFGLRFGFR